MRFSLDTLTVAVLALISTSSLAHPQLAGDVEIAVREAAASLEQRDSGVIADVSDLWKRKGGGGGGGKGGGSSGGSSGSSSGSSSSGSSSGSRGGTSGSSGPASSSSNAGGRTIQGSGVTPNYGGGRYYGGGATQPYKSGGRSPLGLVAFPLVGGALLLYPGLWLYGAYAYNYQQPYSFSNRTGRRNRTSTSTSASPTATPTPSKRSLLERFFEIEMRQAEDTGVNETKPVTCLCAQYAVCGCDDNSDTSFLDSIIGNGDYSTLNKSLVDVADINGTSTIVLNGTLPNGTTGSGGTEDANGSTSSGSSSVSASRLLQASGYWVMIALVGCTCFLV